MTARLDRVGAAVAAMLRRLPAEDGPGELAVDLAVILALELGPLERLAVASAAVMAIDAENAEAVALATLADLRAADPAAERESERMRRQFAAHCANSTYRSPPLSRRGQRQAARIRLDASPRAMLAEAWEAASLRDRRDLIDRATWRTACGTCPDCTRGGAVVRGTSPAGRQAGLASELQEQAEQLRGHGKTEEVPTHD